MRILKKVVLFVVVLVALIAVVGFFLPRQVHVERSTVIAARPATLHFLLSSFRNFNKWSPWFDLDPDAQYTYSGPDFGVGAKLAWVSQRKDVGSGSQEIIELRAPEMVKVGLDFGEQGKATAQFDLTPEGEGTKVVWGADFDMGANPFFRYFGLMMDSMGGKDFEKGLASLKTFAEALPKTDLADVAVQKVDLAPVTVAYFAASSTRDEAAIAAAIGAAYGQVGLFMTKNGVNQAGPVLTINNKWDESGYEFDAAIPIDHAPEKGIPADSKVQVKQTYAGPALKVVHKGSYHGMPATYDKLTGFMKVVGYEAGGAPWDEYVSDPGNTAEADLITNIYMPIK